MNITAKFSTAMLISRVTSQQPSCTLQNKKKITNQKLLVQGELNLSNPFQLYLGEQLPRPLHVLLDPDDLRILSAQARAELTHASHGGLHQSIGVILNL